APRQPPTSPLFPYTTLFRSLQLPAHLVDVGRLLVAQLDADAAGEVQREVEAAHGDAADGGGHEQDRHRQRDPAQAQEVDLAVVRENVEWFHPGSLMRRPARARSRHANQIAT